MKHKFNFFSRLIPLLALLLMLPATMWGEQWVKTDFTSLTTSDVFVIAELTNAKALSNAQITSRNAAAALAVTFNSDKSEIISTSVTNAMKWQFENSTVTNEFYLKTADNGYYLSFQNNNAGLVINTAKTSFHMESKSKSSTNYSYITGSDGSNTRYLNLYNNTDWRCYKSSALVVTNVAFFKLVDEKRTLSSIDLSGTYPTSFNKGDAFSHEGMTVTAKFSNAEDADVTSKATFSGYNMNQAGNQTVTVSYTEGAVTKTATYGINVAVVPVINAANPEMYDASATDGEISYTVSDATQGVDLTAALQGECDWIHNISVNASTVSFEMDANTSAARSATIRLSYTGAANKDITISQDKATVYTTYNKINNKANAIIGGTYVWLAANTANDVTTYYYTKDFENTNTYFNAAPLAQDSRMTETQAKLTDENALTFSIDMKADGWTIVNGSNKVLAITADKKIAWKDAGTNFSVWTMNDDASFQMATTYNSNTTYKMLYNYNSGNCRVNAYNATNKYPVATLYHLASESAHTLTLDPNHDDVAVTTYNVKDGYQWVPVAPTREDYIFAGWATTKEGDVVCAAGMKYTMPSEATTLFAKWLPTTGTLNFVATDGETNYATFSSDRAVKFGEDVTVYTVTAEDNALTLNSVSKQVPANTGVLLSCNGTSADYDFIASATSLGDNALYAASIEKSTLANHKFYKLAYASSNKDALGFYWGAAEGVAFESRKGSAYLAIPATATAAPLRGFSFSDLLNPSNPPIVTGIEEGLNKYVKSGKTLINGKLYIIRDSKVFDMNGRLVK